MATKQANKNTITLKGSTEIITEFFGYSINSILYQRGIYPPEDFTKVMKYDLPMMISKDEALKKYLRDVLNQLSDWIMKGEVQKLVLVVTGIDTNEVLERWVFDVVPEIPHDGKQVAEKPMKEITEEIKALIRQITASVTFLPLLNEPCSFDLLVYTNVDTSVPQAWEESDPRFIKNSSEVRMRSFTTKVHRVDTMVSYKGSD
eukprot:TRINITY_DN9795_c0_g1_i1.p1 TRINITY_DN9795_c0_g1~~TRINITY_DN9795_c0_g1_i1.p1  ORF type:complete len:203 (-),score=44.69 TRINITY_DN9795_c0_g1_i1:294-902(-)